MVGPRWPLTDCFTPTVISTREEQDTSTARTSNAAKTRMVVVSRGKRWFEVEVEVAVLLASEGFDARRVG